MNQSQIFQRPKKHQSFRYALLIIAVFAYLCCPDRSDFNLPLGIFSFILWSDQQISHKKRIIQILIFSLFGDALWIIFVSFIKWNQDQHINQTNKAMHQLTRIVSILNLFYKFGLIIYAKNNIESCKDLFNYQKEKLYHSNRNNLRTNSNYYH